MSAYNGLPEITLSKKCAKYLLTRNAGEKALLRKESFLIEKAKTKQEKAFRRERELLIHRECRNRELIQTTQLYGRTSVTLKQISRSNKGESDWEIKSDTSYARQRRRPGVLFNKKVSSVASSRHSIFSNSTNQGGDQGIEVPRTSGRFRSLSCVLPPI